jgi:hypothetical protein
MEFTEENVSDVLFYLCADCLIKISEDSYENIDGFHDFREIVFLLPKPICSCCNGLIHSNDYTTKIRKTAEIMNKHYQHWHGRGYCYYPFASTHVSIGI